jgi:hypothetical protein
MHHIMELQTITCAGRRYAAATVGCAVALRRAVLDVMPHAALQGERIIGTRHAPLT